ncbi:hypothetical protein XM38_001980 [Halomicronema hongdechloris C2206]|uniref:Metal-binding protein n=1 Tax=Halomicronema hongdechloris C2206 TaxID=1641165 RepID=A0A1Z3HG80_9CYAN|nr:YceD family protein [Halomicronema hongdechloris]ASC69271.1 hypothetical protein XM38_001980 [Halomicronema hongdechloris C2206]
MDAVYIPQLVRAPNQTQVISIQEYLADLETLTPVRGDVSVSHQGNYLQVSGQAETIVTLTCHRCLQNYNHRLLVETQELIWLENSQEKVAAPLEQEVTTEDLVETLPPNGYFHPNTWLYEQLCLALPQRQLCASDCPGVSAKESSGEVPSSGLADQRWSALAALKQQLADQE